MTYTIGHRGAGFLEPENTLLGIRKGVELGMDFIEIDVRETKDGEIVLLHDETLERTTNGKGKLKNFTFDELQKLDAGNGEKIPLLADAIAETIGRAKMLVEMKEQGIEEKVAELINIFRAERDIIVTSFFEDSLVEIKRHGNFDTQLSTKNFGSSIRTAANIGATIISSFRDQTTRENVERAHKEGLMVFVAACDTREDIELMVKFGCDAVTSNMPDLLIKVVK